jgi:hypothetical protein
LSTKGLEANWKPEGITVKNFKSKIGVTDECNPSGGEFQDDEFQAP